MRLNLLKGAFCTNSKMPMQKNSFLWAVNIAELGKTLYFVARNCDLSRTRVRSVLRPIQNIGFAKRKARAERAVFSFR